VKKQTPLTEALANAAGRPVPHAELPDPPAKPTSGRAGLINVTGYFRPEVRASIHLIQASHPKRSVQDLLGEALDDLFAKYNVPQCARSTHS
jgi:hypothetical protein